MPCLDKQLISTYQQQVYKKHCYQNIVHNANVFNFYQLETLDTPNTVRWLDI